MLKEMAINTLQKLIKAEDGAFAILKVANTLFSEKKLKKLAHYLPGYQRHVALGLLNHEIIGSNIQSIWPHWVYKQLLPDSPHFSGSQLPPILLNNTNRNWTGLSFPGVNETPIVDPCGLITPNPFGWSLDLWVANSTKITSAAKLQRIGQTINPNYPLISTDFQVQDLDIKSETFYKHYNQSEDLLFNRVSLTNKGDKALKFSIILAIRPYNPEGLAPISDIVYMTNNAFIVNNRLGLLLDKKPDNVICLNHDDGDILNFYGKWEMIFQTKCPMHQASALAEYQLTIPPGETQTITAKLPIETPASLKKVFQKTLNPKQKKGLQKRINTLQTISLENELDKCKRDWKALRKSTTKFTFSNPKTQAFIDQTISHIFGLQGQTQLVSGSFTYNTASFLSSIMTARLWTELNEFHFARTLLNTLLADACRSLKKPFPQTSLENASLLLQGIYDYLRITQDFDWVEKRLSNIDQLEKIILAHPIKKSVQTRALKSLLLKNIQTKSLYLDNADIQNLLWASTGLESHIHIRILLEKPSKSAKPKQLLALLQDKLSNKLDAVNQQSQALKETHSELSNTYISSLIGCYPMTAISPKHPSIQRYLQSISPNLLSSTILYSFSGHSGISPTQNFHLAQLYIQNDPDKASSILTELMSLATETGCWPETIHPVSHGGMVGDGQYTLAHVESLRLLRNCLVKEDSTTLWITPAIPKEWLGKQGDTIGLEKAPTRFGPIDFQLKHKGSSIELLIKHQFHTKPKDIRIRLPYTISTLKLAHTEKKVNSDTTSIPIQAQSIEFIIKK
ncbi:hypothetical protein HOH87_06165 [bacterium]|jgi:hypothetical protein|nr:hypothetical protein [bacterium]